MDRASRILLILILPAGGCADGILLHPTSQPLETPAVRRVVRQDRGDLELWTMRAQGAPETPPAAYVLAFVGNGDRAERGAAEESELWRDHPFEIWVMNYPGFGGSTGPPGLNTIPPSALAAFDEIRKVAAGRPVLVSGSSLGAAAALFVAARRPVGGVLLRNPPPLRELILGHYGWWNLWLGAWIVTLQIPPELDSLRNARECTAPAVFLISQQDRRVPPAYQRDVVDAYGGTTTIVPLEGGHNKRPGPRELDTLRPALRSLASRAQAPK